MAGVNISLSMIKKLILGILLFIPCLFLFLHFSEVPPCPDKDLRLYLPGEAETGGWKEDGLPQIYVGEDLFTYINGGAEIYHEYGFKQVIVQDFLNKNKKSISLEIFEMSNPESAYGMYTFKTNPGGEELALGDEAQLADYYMNFWKGKFIITLTGFDEDEGTIKGLQKIARAVETKIKISGEKPPLVSFLPKKNLLTQSIKYFKGNLGLYNSYPFFARDVFGIDEGIKGDYREVYSFYIIKYKNDNECQKRFDEAKVGFEGSPRYRDFMFDKEELIQVRDGKGKLIFISRFKRYILIVRGTLSQVQARKIFASFALRSDI